MAYKNTHRLDADDQFYHIYNRGVAKMDIFISDDDYQYFESLIEQLLFETPRKDVKGRDRKNYFGKIEIHTYCLMPNHFHFLIKQISEGAASQFLSSLSIAYSIYFNKKYSRRGPVFESRFKSILIDNDDYLIHVSRYIHLNPLGFRSWAYSSYNDFVYGSRSWVSTDFILDIFRTKKHYIAFVDDYKEKDELTGDYDIYFGDH